MSAKGAEAIPDPLPLKARAGQGFRVVESQTKAATMNLVDSLEEQRILETLLEVSKPPNPAATPKRHYLIQTPFRYPPLQYGSRFGTTMERGIFYGSEALETAFAETAFYTLLFRDHSKDLGDLTSSKTSFRFTYEASRFLDTTSAHFAHLRTELDSPTNYAVAQSIGQRLRQAEGEVVLFKSVRCPRGGNNLAVFSVDVLGFRPTKMTQWRMDLRGDEVSFLEPFQDQRLTFAQAEFGERGVFSHPSRTG